MSTERHPQPFELESLHAGEDCPPSVARHAEDCAKCGAYLEELAREGRAFAAERDAERFVRGIRARVDAGRGTPAPAWSFFPRPSGRVVPRRGVVVSLSALAAVGAWMLVARLGHVAPERLQARGGLEVAVVVLHDGAQSRVLGPVTGAPGDAFRVEVALLEQAVLDAIVVDDRGRVVTLAEGRRFAAGTHYLEPALTFDDLPTTARVLIGPPAGVRRAREEGAAPGVAVVDLRSQGGP